LTSKAKANANANAEARSLGLVSDQQGEFQQTSTRMSSQREQNFVAEQLSNRAKLNCITTSKTVPYFRRMHVI
jgi:hypothetical protein